MRRRLADMRTMKELFTNAEAEAQRAGESEPGAEHLLLAAVELPDGSARRAFDRVGVDPAALRDAIADQHDDALRAVGVEATGDALTVPPAAPPRGPYRTKGSAQTLFQRVTTLVRSERSQLYGAWFVLAATESENGTTARALRRLGIETDDLAAAARAELDALRG
jgi:ATP-dependent Clp protease ATP-binding subunit ClpA